MCALVNLVDLLLYGYLFVVLAAVVISWLNPDPAHPLVRFVYRLTDPLFREIRRVTQMEGLGLDLSPLVVVFAIYLIRTGLRRITGC